MTDGNEAAAAVEVDCVAAAKANDSAGVKQGGAPVEIESEIASHAPWGTEISISGNASPLSSSTESMPLSSKIAACLAASKLRSAKGTCLMGTASADAVDDCANTSEAMARPKSPVALLASSKDRTTAAASLAALAAS
jgi:hypothetical protein